MNDIIEGFMDELMHYGTKAAFGQVCVGFGRQSVSAQRRFSEPCGGIARSGQK